MEIKIECPWCNQHYSVDESYVGQKVECSVCNKEFVVRFQNISVQTSASTLSTPNAPAASHSRIATKAISENKLIDFYSKLDNQSNAFLSHNKENSVLLPKSSNRTSVVTKVFIGLIVFVLIIFCIIFFIKTNISPKSIRKEITYTTQQHQESNEERQNDIAVMKIVESKNEINNVIEQVNKIEEWKAFFTASTLDEEQIMALRKVILNMKAIDTSRCPSDFCTSYEHCIQSYEKLLDLLLDASTRDENNLKEWKNNLKKCVEECKSKNSFADIEFFAAKYGAKAQFSPYYTPSSYDNALDWMFTWVSVGTSLRVNAGR